MKQWDLITDAPTAETADAVEPLKCRLIGTNIDQSVLAVDVTRLSPYSRESARGPKNVAVFVTDRSGPTIEEESKTRIISAFMRLLTKLNYTSKHGTLTEADRQSR
jgi:hypothetical protein